MRHCLRGLLAIALVSSFVAAPAMASVVVNEIMYNSNYSPDIEYIELYNTGPAAQNLVDWYLLDNGNAHPKCYLAGTLGVGQYLVIAADTALFRARFPGVTNLNPNGFDPGGLGFGLGNSGDQVRLFDDNGTIRDSVAYLPSGDWPADANGHGPSLELVNPLLDNSVGTNWLASVPVGGTPGVVNSQYRANAAPVCDNGKRNVDLPRATAAVTISVRAVDPENHLTSVTLWVNSGSGYVSQPMYDDGLHGDGAASDSIYGAVIPAKANGTVVKYYAKAVDNLGQYNTWPDNAPDLDHRAYTVGYTPPRVVVNEIEPDNTDGILNDVGVRSDWLEVYNPNGFALDLGGMYLTDNRDNGNKWMIHYGTTLAAGGYMLFWADGDTLNGPRHTDFKLDAASGEEVGIFTAQDLGNVEINGWKYGPVAANVTVGYKPDYNGITGSSMVYFPEYLATPTPGASNNTSPYYSSVCINEFQTTSLAGGTDDWIELYNRGSLPYNLSGAYLSDNRTDNTKYQFPNGTTLAAGQFLLLNETQFGFNLATTGEVIVLTAADSTSGLDFYDFKQEAPDTSEGRYPDGYGRWVKFHPTTLGSSNTSPLAVQPPAPHAGVLGMLMAAPNPLHTHTEISFELGRAGRVSAAIYDAAGRRVHVLYDGAMAAGTYAMMWNGQGDSGGRLPTGLYFVRVSVNSVSKSCRMLLLN